MLMEFHDALFALIGGALIGLSAGALLLFSGRIAGISGIIGGVLSPQHGDTWWRLMFVAGLLSGGAVLRIALPHRLPSVLAVSGSGWGVLVASGLLVGIGTRLGSGCTSGHGVCGVARLSPRSLVATATFVGFGMLTVLITRHLFY
jgi:hypothetical protein